MPRSFSGRTVGDIASRGGLSGIAGRIGRSLGGNNTDRGGRHNITWQRGYSARRDIETEEAVRRTRAAAIGVSPRDDTGVHEAHRRALTNRSNFILANRDHPEFAAYDRSRSIGEGVLSIAPSLIGGPVLGQMFNAITGRGVAGALTRGGVFGRLGDPGAVRSFSDLFNRLGLVSDNGQQKAAVVPARRARGYGRRGPPDWLLGNITNRSKPSYFSLLGNNFPY